MNAKHPNIKFTSEFEKSDSHSHYQMQIYCFIAF